MRGERFTGALCISPARHFLFILLVFLLIEPLYGQTGRISGLEMPAPKANDQIIDHKYFILQFNDKYKEADWSAYVLEAKMLVKGCERTNDFRSDPEVRTGSSTPEDFLHSGWDRGHLTPAADFKYSCKSMSSTFFMSNMIPQYPSLNRGMWSKLESVIRSWAEKTDEPLYIVTGPVLKDGPFDTIGIHHVAIPKYIFKAVLVYNDKETKAIAFIMPNGPVKGTLEAYAVPVNKVEEVTGLDLYHGLPDVVEGKIESSLDLTKWDFSAEKKGGHGRKEKVVPAAPQAQEQQSGGDCQYWLNTSSGVRHNRNCPNFGSTKHGRCCGSNEGKPCGRCGG